MMLALTVYEDGLCSCGQPVIISHHPDNEGWYDAEKVQCQSCATRELATSGNGKDPYKPSPGEKTFTRYTRPANKPLGHDHN